ncbi:hypothetical protein WA026_019261 [Henosepilachna vigintioctopunctata]|uniref:Uncharacterized protein n=1 Tax=Henosepilachna vigintioctopunctata TaxID=420089 RepID=A0AAW1UCD8_9CUCU
MCPKLSECNAPNSQNVIPQNQMCNNCNCQRKQNYQQKCFDDRTNNSEIQCKNISQSQMSPGIVSYNQPKETQSNHLNTNTNNIQPMRMRQDTYQRTLEYVQHCQSWVGNSERVTSSTHPLARTEGEETCSNMEVVTCEFPTLPPPLNC